MSTEVRAGTVVHVDTSPVGRASGMFAASAGADLCVPGIIARRKYGASAEPTFRSEHTKGPINWWGRQGLLCDQIN
ncbi:hypothetical protein C7T36_18600 [Rhodococcus sp. AD45-ID]|nr:hypothetical protein C7T36_18600 [Rhodococcus sp. AD45-ID]